MHPSARIVRHAHPGLRAALLLVAVAVALATVALVCPDESPAFVPVAAGSGWEWQTAVPQPETLRAVARVGDQCWAGGDGGTILHSGDGGATWDAQSSETTGAIGGLSFVDARHGWAAGAVWDDAHESLTGGFVLATDDGGATWRPQDPGVSEVFNAVLFTDVAHGYVVGDDGTILRTADGGLTWQVTPSGTKRSLLGVSFPTATDGWVVGARGTILHTDDGGATWRPQRAGLDARLTGVSFVDARHGWMVGVTRRYSETVIMRTTDGGATWRKDVTPGMVAPSAVSFADRKSGIFVGWGEGDSGVIGTTKDGGRHWRHWTWQPHHLEAVALDASGRVVAVGGSGFIVTGEVRGSTWTRRDSGTSTLNFDVSFSDPQHGWVLRVYPGEGAWLSYISATSDGGATWTTTPFSRPGRYRGDVTALDFVDTQRGWAAGPYGIFVTTDGGAHWRAQRRDVPYGGPFYSVDFVDASHGWVVCGGDVDAVLATTDGGATWRRQRTGIQGWVTTASFADTRHGWIVSRLYDDYNVTGSMLLATTDGGATWHAQDPGTDAEITGIHALDATHCWLTTATSRAKDGEPGGAVLATADGGATWRQQYAEAGADLLAVDFADLLHGWAAGTGGTVLATRDGGVTWTAQVAAGAGDLTALDFVDAAHGWVLAAPDGVLATTTGGWPAADGRVVAAPASVL